MPATIVFVGPPGSGKTTLLCLLNWTLRRYKEELGIDYYEMKIRHPRLELVKWTNELGVLGKPVPRTPAEMKDLKAVFEIKFKGIFGAPLIRMIVCDLSGLITSTLSRILPDLAYKTPEEVINILREFGFTKEDIQEIVSTIMDADGVILVGDSTQIATGDPILNPDIVLNNFLTTLTDYLEVSRKKRVKGVALFISKIDVWLTYFQTYDINKADLKDFVEKHLGQTSNFLHTLQRKYKIHCDLFYSWLRVGEADEQGQIKKFMVDERQKEVLYSKDQYKALILWMRETFK